MELRGEQKRKLTAQHCCELRWRNGLGLFGLLERGFAFLTTPHTNNPQRTVRIRSGQRQELIIHVGF